MVEVRAAASVQLTRKGGLCSLKLGAGFLFVTGTLLVVLYPGFCHLQMMLPTG